MIFPVVVYGCESWTIRKAECQRIDAFELWCWKRPLRVPWAARRSKQSILSSGQSLSSIWLCDPMNCIMPDISVIPSLCPWLCSNSCSLSQWYQPTISSSVVPFSSCPQSFLELGPLQRVSSFHTWPKYWSFSFSISPCNEYSGLISFKMDWLDLLAVLGTLKGLFQHHSSKASILQR